MADFLTVLIPALGRALLQFVWQGALIGLLAALALQLLRDARPQARYLIACLALLACVLVPAATVLMQLVGAASTPAEAVLAPGTQAIGMTALPAADLAAWPARLERLLPHDLLPLIVALWAAGASVLSLRMALGALWIRRLRATPQGPAHAVWQARLDALAQSFGLPRVALRLVDGFDSPASAGWLRPVVLLPSALLTRMPVELIEALLAHELAHVRRHDYLVNLLQGVVEALLFYHPVTWWLSRRIRIEREHIADRLAADVIGAPRRLALALSALSELRPAASPFHAPPHLAQAAQSTHGGHLMSRIQQLVQPGRRAAGGKIAFPLLGLAAACIALYAQAQVAQPEPTPAPVAAPAALASRAPASVPAPAVSRGPVLPSHEAFAQVTRISDDEPREAFALVRKGRDGISMSGSIEDIDSIKAARASVDRDFVWFRRANRSYVIDDPATVARALAAWREVDRLSPQMEALEQQMEPHERKLEALSEQMEQMSEQQHTPAMEAASRRMEQLGTEQERLAERHERLAADMARADDAGRERLESQMDALGEQMDALSEQMDQQGEVLNTHTEQFEAPMEALSDQMERASEPMEALSEQMEVLSEQQERHVEAAERELQQLISAAIAQGLAKPAPGRASKQ